MSSDGRKNNSCWQGKRHPEIRLRPPLWLRLLITHVMASYLTFALVSLGEHLGRSGRSFGVADLLYWMCAPLTVPYTLVGTLLVCVYCIVISIAPEGLPVLQWWGGYLGSFTICYLSVTVWAERRSRRRLRGDQKRQSRGGCPPSQAPALGGGRPENAHQEGHSQPSPRSGSESTADRGRGPPGDRPGSTQAPTCAREEGQRPRHG